MEPLRELGSLITRHAPLASAHGSWKDERLGLMVGTASRVSAPAHQVYEPVFALVVQGEKRLVLGDQIFTCGKGTFLVVSVDLPITFRVSRATPEHPYLALAMTLKPAAVATLLLEAATVQSSPAFLDCDLPVLGPMIEKEILWRLLCSEQGQRLRQIGLADSRLSQIGRAMRWMRENYREALPTEDLARLSAMSVTSFHRHFRAAALMSPLQYLKRIRLQEARARLLAMAEDVATVGHAVGYDSPSQFSREYKRAYGSPPGEDARLLRAANHASK